jgi:predicted GNAT family acetyltransferase
MEFDLEAVKVINNTEAHQFEAYVVGYLAVLTYLREGNKIIFDHTGVPDPLSGKGLAAKLVHTGLEYARSERLQVVPLCPYVSLYIEKHPEYRDLVS